MPVYNVEKYVKECITSVLKQTYENIELLIVDDCGKDNSMEIVKSIINEYDGRKTIHIIEHAYNKGLSEARNTAIKEAKGDYIYFIDSDDMMTHECIEILYNAMQKNHVDFVAASYKEINEDGSNRNTRKTLDDITIKNGKAIKEYVFEDFYDRVIVTVWNKLYKLSFIKGHNLYFTIGRYYEDVIFNLKACTQCDSLSFLSDITYLYRQRDNSIMHVGNSVFTEKEVKDRAYTTKNAKLYLRNYLMTNHLDEIILNYAKGSYYYAKGYFKHNDENMFLKPYIQEFLYYPLHLSEVLRIKRNRKEHLYYWLLNKLPYCIVRLLL